MELLWHLNAEQGITVLMVTHEPDGRLRARMVRFVDGVVASEPQPAPTGAQAAGGGFSRQPGEPHVVQHHLARAALHPAQPDALVPHHPGHRDRRERGITMVTLGNGATLAVQTQISSLGTNLLQVRPGQRMGPGGGHGAPSFRTPMPTRLRSRSAAFWRWRRRRAGATVVAIGRNWTTSVIGSTNAWLQTGNWTFRPEAARSPTPNCVPVPRCLIGETIRRELYGGRDPVGEQLRVKRSRAKWWACSAPRARGVWQRPGRHGADPPQNPCSGA